MLKNSFVLTLFLALAAMMVSSCSAFRPVSETRNAPDRSRRSTRTIDHQHQLRKEMSRYAQQLKGARYKYAAQGPRSFDCSGLTSYVYRKFNVELSRSSQVQCTQGKKIPVSKAKPGDLLFFSKRGFGKPTHVALVVANSRDGVVVIHSTSSRGVIEENVSRSSYWKPKMLYARDILSDI